MKKRIEESSKDENGSYNWDTIVRLALKKVYDDNISNYSAVGKVKESRANVYPQIDRRLYNAIFGKSDEFHHSFSFLFLYKKY